MNGNGELTETENVIFYISYGVITDFLRMNVILTNFATETATATATATDTERWKSGIFPSNNSSGSSIRQDGAYARPYFDLLIAPRYPRQKWQCNNDNGK